MRINKEATLAKLPTLSDRATQRVRGDNEYVERVRQPNEALPPSNDLFTRATYRSGDGEQFQSARAGSQDAMKVLSRGYST